MVGLQVAGVIGSILKLWWSLLILAGWSGIAMAIEEPNFQVLKNDEPFELRRYEPILIAEVFVSGRRDEATRQGFRLIADFIFGNNVSTTQKPKKIAMTAPVTVESQKIAMTAPVTIESAGHASDERWRVQFVMPKEYTLETLPKPNNPVVQIRSIPGKVYAVYGYSGLSGEDKVNRYTKELENWIAKQGLLVTGTSQLARYNPPWTLPPFRRNEILLEVVWPSR